VAPRFVVRVMRGGDLIFDAAVPEDPWLDPARRLDRVAAVAGLDPDERVGVDDRDGALIDEATAFLLGDLMAGVVARGTGAGAKAIGRPAAGKTGTTNDNTDAWFIGYTARLLAAVWVGHDDPATTLGPKDDGAHAALPLWVTLVRLAEGARSERAVPGDPPADLERVRVDRETGLLAAPGAGGGADVWFKPGTAPTEEAGRIDGAAADFGRTAREF
jgi:penicillin-binding protein 1A